MNLEWILYKLIVSTLDFSIGDIVLCARLNAVNSGGTVESRAVRDINVWPL